MARLNTSLQSTGAEFLVLGHLLINGIQAYKSYVNHPGYDLMAVNQTITKPAAFKLKAGTPLISMVGFPSIILTVTLWCLLP